MPDPSIKLLSFDLDNTLYDNTDVIRIAEKKSREYIQSEFLASSLTCDFVNFDKIKNELIANGIGNSNNKYQFENLSLLRYQTNLNFCLNLPNPELVAEKALNIFLDFRSKIQVSGVMLSMLEKLAKQYRIVSVTNGNCDPMKTELASFIERNYSPGDGLRAKPHPEMLFRLLIDYKLDNQQILHIGDRLDADQLAADQAGCQFYLFSPFETNMNEAKVCDLLQAKLLN